MKRKLSGLFLCTHNSARSQMAEALLRHYAAEHFQVHSAGLHPSEIHPYARQVLAERGLDIEGQYAKSLMGYWGGKFNFTYLITVCDRAEQECPLFPFSTYRLYWPFEDPSSAQGSEEERLEVFRRVRDQIAAKIQRWLRELEQKNILPQSPSAP
ncbi:arsenate reductase ArsC [Meiothermus rufus]|uniref:arsenate reductase ArsC n=1 Tax=Meiothermus rufus TaxID=604332 RepID=UPI00042407A3|nr:arsenate reductase ArsC [Meiothermus rufus]